jgi:hypothetical protein
VEEALINVVFVAGASRSGSTLLGRLLGAIPGHLDLGELRHLIPRGLVKGQLCGCGEPLPECAFWSEVVADAWGSPPPDEIARMGRVLQAAVRQRRAVRALLTPAGPPDTQAIDLLGRLLGSIRRVSGAQVLVDSGKTPGALLLLGRIPTVRLSVIEIVRDARAVAFSWRRRVERPEIPDRAAEMERLPAWRSALEWDLADGLLAAARRRLRVPWETVRYEDLARKPAEALRGAVAAIGRPDPELEFIRDGSARLGPGHSISGNPMRFAAGATVIRPDEEWRTAMPRRDRALVTALCRPGLARHGYFAAGDRR